MIVSTRVRVARNVDKVAYAAKVSPKVSLVAPHVDLHVFCFNDFLFSSQFK